MVWIVLEAAYGLRRSSSPAASARSYGPWTGPPDPSSAVPATSGSSRAGVTGESTVVLVFSFAMELSRVGVSVYLVGCARKRQWPGMAGPRSRHGGLTRRGSLT